MKKMTCNNLGGPENCEKEFQANSFEEIAELSKNHAMEMFQLKDESHIAAGQKMRELMQDPEKMNQWMLSKKQEFEQLADY
jgi:hypothetical protein